MPGVRVRTSVLDRLIDANPDQKADPAADAPTVPDLLRLVQRDLEMLLNARKPWQVLDRRRPDLRLSPLGYGLGDLGAGALNHAADKEALRTEIEALIRRFEPRLAEVRVTALAGDSPLSTTLPLSIDGLLLVDPDPEPVRFGTVVDPLSPAVTLRTIRDV